MGSDIRRSRSPVVSCGLMQVFRRQCPRLAGGWLVLQLCILSFTPAALCLGVHSALFSAECTCAHGGGEQCPMHHPATTSKSTCSCRSTDDTTRATMASLLGPTAVLPSMMAVSVPPVMTNSFTSIATSLIDAPSVPDAPPPRA